MPDFIENFLTTDIPLALLFIFGPFVYIIRSIKNYFKPEENIEKEDFVGFSVDMTFKVFAGMVVGLLILIPVVIGFFLGVIGLIFSFIFG